MCGEKGSRTIRVELVRNFWMKLLLVRKCQIINTKHFSRNVWLSIKLTLAKFFQFQVGISGVSPTPHYPVGSWSVYSETQIQPDSDDGREPLRSFSFILMHNRKSFWNLKKVSLVGKPISRPALLLRHPLQSYVEMQDFLYHITYSVFLNTDRPSMIQCPG